MSVVTDDLTTLVDSCTRVGWHIHDTGERIATDDGPDAEAVIVIRVPTTSRSAPPSDSRPVSPTSVLLACP